MNNVMKVVLDRKIQFRFLSILTFLIFECNTKPSPAILGIITPTKATVVEPALVKGSFQSGNVTLTASSQNITLATVVDSSKAFVLCNAKYDASATDKAITCQLSSDGTLVTIQSGGGLNAAVDWYVMEFSSGATVQRGSTSFLTTDSAVNASITAVSIGTAFVLSYARSTVAGSTADGNRTVRARLATNSVLALSRLQTGGAANVEWQVVQFDGAKVQSGLSTIANGSSSTSAALSDAVNLSSSFLVFNYRSAAVIAGVEPDYYTRGSYTNTASLAFNRVGTNGDIDIAWFAVEMTDGTTVQSGTATMTGNAGFTNTNTTSTLTTSVTTTKSMIVFSNDTTSATASDSAAQDSGTYTATFGSSTLLNFTRSKDENNGATIPWYVVSFQ